MGTKSRIFHKGGEDVILKHICKSAWGQQWLHSFLLRLKLWQKFQGNHFFLFIVEYIPVPQGSNKGRFKH